MTIHESLGYLLNTAAKMIKRQLDARLKQYGITTAQFAVLKLLSQHEGLSQAEAAEMLHADRATSGVVIDALAAKGLITKEMCKTDRRSFIINLAPGAMGIVNEAAEHARGVNMTAAAGLTGDEINVLVKCLKTIQTNLEE